MIVEGPKNIGDSPSAIRRGLETNSSGCRKRELPLRRETESETYIHWV